ncbi:MAG: methyl-accepting chemotaxis protein, partial [Ignavibacterium sp.]
MRWFLNLTTRTKLLITSGLMIAFLAVVIATAYTGLMAVQERQKRLFEVNFIAAVDLVELRADLDRQRSRLLEMSITKTRSEQEALRERIQTRTRESEESLNRLTLLFQGDAIASGKLEEIRRLMQTFVQVRDNEVIPLILAGKTQEAERMTLGPQSERFERIRSISIELGNQAAEDASALMNETTTTVQSSITTFLVVGIGVTVLALIMALSLASAIAKPLKQLSTISEQIALGDLTVSLATNGRSDEVGMLTASFRKMIESLRKVTGEIREGVSVLGSAASEILAGTTQVAAGASETATAVSETTTTVEEVKQTAQVST